MSILVDRTAKFPQTAVPRSVPAPDHLDVKWLGIDKRDIPKTKTQSAAYWVGSLIDHSNLRFTGAYLEGEALSGHPTGEFTGSSKAVSRGWMQNLDSLRTQGWGIAFWYVGYSKPDERIPSDVWAPAWTSSAQASERGRLHAQHAKTIVAAANPQLAGAIVFFDNENFDPRGNANNERAILDALETYYLAFFDELETPGPGSLPAMRCGLYGHAGITNLFLNARPDLLVWDVKLDTGRNTYGDPPFLANADPLIVDAARRGIEVQRTAANVTPTRKAWALGRQFRYILGSMPSVGSPLATILEPVEVFDYDSSLVRDPAYPVAEPRIAAAPDRIVVTGSFLERTAGGAGDPPRSAIERIEAAGRNSITVAASQFVEPDAPIAIAACTGAATHFMTVLTTGDLASFSRDTSGSWTPIDLITPNPDLRRLRAIALIAFNTDDLHAFYVGSNHGLYTTRKTGSGPWQNPGPVGAPLALHPFSSIAVAFRDALAVDVFALDDQECLTTAWWTANPDNWPPTESQQLETTPSLLKATALAATSPNSAKEFVFGVGRNLHLRCAEWKGSSGEWSPLIDLGAAEDLLCPHTRLAAHSYDSTVEVIAVNNDATLRLYSIVLNGTVWTAQPPVAIANPIAAAPQGYIAPGAASPTEPAYGWLINPFGDLSITREGTVTVIYAAGVMQGRSGLLRRELSSTGTWELLR